MGGCGSALESSVKKFTFAGEFCGKPVYFYGTLDELVHTNNLAKITVEDLEGEEKSVYKYDVTWTDVETGDV